MSRFSRSRHIEALVRKLRFVKRFASIRAIGDVVGYWAGLLQYIHANVSANIMFRFLMNIYLALSAHLDPAQFEFHPLDFTKIFVIPYEPRPFTPPRGKIPDGDIERIMWYFRWSLTTKEGLFIKLTNETARKLMRYIKDMLVAYNADPLYADILFELYSIVEGKLPVLSIVGMAIVGITKVAPPTFPVRLPRDWKTTIECQNAYVYESHVGIARVGYARVIELPGSLTEDVVKHISGRIGEHIKRQSTIASSPEYVFYPRVFFWRRIDRMHWRGGAKQLQLQRLYQEIRPILDRNGVIVQMRNAYMTYAYEIKYMYHAGHEHTKYFKMNLIPEDIKRKYLMMGLDKNILDQIEKIVLR